MIVRIAIVSLAASLFSLTALAAGPVYVDKFGDDNNPCNRALPCLTISEAIIRAGTNGRVTVGPGVYNEPLYITQSGLKLTSSSGADTTVINMRIPGNIVLRDYGIEIAADRVLLGQRNKGFTIRGGLNNIDVYAEGNGNRIEGNRIVSALNSLSVAMLGDSLTLRYNTIDAGFRNGVFISRPVVNQVGGRRWVVDNNVVRRASTAMKLTSTAPNNRMRITNNRMEDIRGEGFIVENMETTAGGEVPSTTRSGDRHSNNSVYRLDGRGGSGFMFIGGNPQADRLSVSLAELSDSGVSLIQTDNASVRNSTFMGEEVRAADPNVEDPSVGIWMSDATGSRIQSNSFVNMSYGILSSRDFSGSRFLNNNIWGSYECALRVFTPVTATGVLFRGNFWGAPGDPDTSCDANAQTLVDNDVISFRPAAAPN